jgi:hypothetical protein
MRVGTGIALALGISAALAVTALALASTRRLTVTPAAGTPHTIFRLTFRAPEPTGSASGLERSIVLSASRRGTSRGCVGQIERNPTASHAGQLVHVALAPHGKWCIGRFTGDVDETGRPICKPTTPCPQFIELTPIGRFSFVVRRTTATHN